MKSSVRATLGAMGGLFAVATGAHAGGQSTQGTASVTINEAALSVSQVSNHGLDFGTVIPSGGADTVSVDPAAAESPTFVSSSGVQQSGGQLGKFTVSGQPYANVGVSLPSSTITLANGGASNPPTITGLSSSLSGATALDNSGALTFYVGGTLNLATGFHASGTYSSTFTVTVSYQ